MKTSVVREGVPYIAVNPAYTSKTCSACGHLNKDLKAEKEWDCPSCGVVHDRDVNAASNLANMAKDYLEELKKPSVKVVE